MVFELLSQYWSHRQLQQKGTQTFWDTTKAKSMALVDGGLAEKCFFTIMEKLREKVFKPDHIVKRYKMYKRPFLCPLKVSLLVLSSSYLTQCGCWACDLAFIVTFGQFRNVIFGSGLKFSGFKPFISITQDLNRPKMI